MVLLTLKAVIAADGCNTVKLIFDCIQVSFFFFFHSVAPVLNIVCFQSEIVVRKDRGMIVF